MLKFYRMRELASVEGREGRPGRQGRYPVSAATLWRWVAAGKFPSPVKLSGGTTAWPVEIIEVWEREQVAPTPAKTIQQRQAAGAASVAARNARREVCPS